MRASRTLGHLLPTLLPLLLGGCFDFEVQEKVLDLRPITVVADPPEIMVVVRQGEGDEPLFTVIAEPAPSTVSLLVANPRAPDVPIIVTAKACLSNELRVCDGADSPVMDLGRFTSMIGTTTIPFAPDMAQINTWLKADPFQGFGGLYILITFAIEQDGFPPDRIGKLITYNVPFVPRGEGQDPPPQKVANRNPRLDGLLVGGELHIESLGIQVEAGKSVELEPVFNKEIAIEDYPVINFPDVEDGDVGYSVLTEKLEFQFHTTAGSFTTDKLETRNVLGEKDDIKTTFKAPDPFVAPATMWVVTRDDRGGGSWTTWTISPAP